MARYIDADMFLTEESEAFMAAKLKVKDEATRLVNAVVHKKIQMLIADAPIVDAVPVVHGKWIRVSGLTPCCSVCGGCVEPKYDYPYCPNCGAKMDGGQTNDRA